MGIAISWWNCLINITKDEVFIYITHSTTLICCFQYSKKHYISILFLEETKWKIITLLNSDWSIRIKWFYLFLLLDIICLRFWLIITRTQLKTKYFTCLLIKRYHIFEHLFIFASKILFYLFNIYLKRDTHPKKTPGE